MAIGLGFISGGILLLLLLQTNNVPVIALVQTVLSMAIGVIALYRGFIPEKSTWRLFVGFSLVCTSIVLFAANTDLISYTLLNLWPCIVISVGISFTLSAVIAQKQLPLRFLVLSISFVLMGIVFLLFSTHVITVPFRRVAARLWPVLLILIGIFLLIVFQYLKKNQAVGDVSFYDDSDEDD